MSDTYSTPSESSTPPPSSLAGAGSAPAAPANDATNALGIKDDGIDVKALTGKLADIDQQKIVATDKTSSRLDKIQATYNGIAQEHLHAQGVTASKLTNWDAEAETAKHRTDPITAFGSLGSVVGILASAFTHAPMANALNASAAAMTAIKENDIQGYDRAHKAWQENANLTIKRGELEHQAYQDAISVLKTNAELGMKQLDLAMTKYGYQQGKVLHEAGLDDKLFQGIEAKHKAETAFAENMPRAVAAGAYISDLHKFGYNSKNPDDPKNSEAVRLANERWGMDGKRTEPQKITSDFATTPKEDGTYPDAKERAEFWDKHFGLGTRGDPTKRLASEMVDAEMQKNIDNGMERPEALSAAITKVSAEHPDLFKTGASLRKPKPEEEFVQSRAQELLASGAAPTKQEALKKAQNEWNSNKGKAFNAQESARITYTPTLLRSLEVLNDFNNDSTGLFTGVMKKFAAEYVGVNQPVQLWQAARDQAQAAITALAPTGSKSVMALKAQIEQLPETPQASSFNAVKIGNLMRSVADETQSALSVMEAGGKKIPDDVLEKLSKFGVTVERNKDKNPVLNFMSDPQGVSDAELSQLIALRSSYPKEMYDKLRAEAARRDALAAGK